jgi:polysaccharide export outer membrane protein
MCKKTNPSIRSLILLLVLIGLLSSCVSSEKIIYFQEDGTETGKEVLPNFEPIIGVDDLLAINIATIDMEAAVPFNVSAGVQEAGGSTYLVDVNGEIDFPVIGRLKVAGFTTKALRKKLKSVLSEYLIKPTVAIRLLNFKVTIMGAVGSPGSFNIPSERITIVEALALAGDLQLLGKRKNVLLIREKEGERMYVNIDLTNRKLFSSPYYYLAPNDLLYVEPNKRSINTAGRGVMEILQITTILTTLILLLTR